MALTPVPTTTTLGADLAQTAITATFASTTGFVATQGNTGLGTQLVIGAEIVNVLSVVNSTVATIERGVGGTAAAFHPNGTTVTYGLSSSLGPQLASSFQQSGTSNSGEFTPYVASYISSACHIRLSSWSTLCRPSTNLLKRITFSSPKPSIDMVMSPPVSL